MFLCKSTCTSFMRVYQRYKRRVDVTLVQFSPLLFVLLLRSFNLVQSSVSRIRLSLLPLPSMTGVVQTKRQRLKKEKKLDILLASKTHLPLSVPPNSYTSWQSYSILSLPESTVPTSLSSWLNMWTVTGFTVVLFAIVTHSSFILACYYAGREWRGSSEIYHHPVYYREF